MNEDLVRYWNLYFPQDQISAYTNEDHRHVIIKGFYNGVMENRKLTTILNSEMKVTNHIGSLTLNFTKLKHNLNDTLRGVLDYLYEAPDDVLRCLNVSFHAAYKNLFPDVKLLSLMTRITHFDSPIPLAHLKSNFINKFISTRGTVIFVSNVKLLVTSMRFTCLECSAIIDQSFQNGKYEQPQECEKPGCKSRMFNPERRTAKTVLWQRLKIQEIDDEVFDSANFGKIPQTMECELRGDLVDSCITGDVITVTGILKPESSRGDPDNKNFKIKNKGLYGLYIEINAISNTRSSSKPITANTDKLDDTFTQIDYKRIEEIANHPNLFALMIKSLCPAIYGHELVKAGLILTLFGGTPYENVRPDCHVLIIGDPGLGKSQMLKSLVNFSPRGVYVSGNASTNSGLTVTMVKDSATGENSLEAGALILGDQGICCIDEFDKMNGDQALLEVMEQQTISIAKSGVLCSLSARTSIVAAANPIGGHYNVGRTLRENIKINRAILSRFDLIFLLLDSPDFKQDKKLSEHVMKLHSKVVQKKKKKPDETQTSSYNPSYATQTQLSQFFIKTDDSNSIKADEESVRDPSISLSKRLVSSLNELDPQEVIAGSILKKYIAYAKRYVHPRLSPEAAVAIQDFYLNLRSIYDENDSLPATTRQLESLIRLSQARAKVEMRETVTIEDAQDVIQLMEESVLNPFVGMASGGSNPNGHGSFSGINQRNSLNDVGNLSVAKQTRIFSEKLRIEAEEKGGKIFEYAELVTIGKSINMRVGDFRMFVDKLNAQNVLLLKGKNVYELCASGF